MAAKPFSAIAAHSRLAVPNKLQSLQQIGEYIAREMRRYRLPEEKIFDVQVAVDEACTNIIQYAFPGGEESEIHLECHYQDGRFQVEILDNGQPFDPITLDNPELSDTLEERDIGGLGVMFMKQLMDELRYQYHEKSGFEQLTLVKYV